MSRTIWLAHCWSLGRTDPGGSVVYAPVLAVVGCGDGVRATVATTLGVVEVSNAGGVAVGDAGGVAVGTTVGATGDAALANAAAELPGCESDGKAMPPHAVQSRAAIARKRSDLTLR